MKRSKINSIIREMEELIRENGFNLPPFATGHLKIGKTKVMNMMK